MRNDPDKQHLDYTMLLEPYEGYTVEWATSRSRSEQGKWMGHFRAYKDETPTIFGSVANLQNSEADAQNKAVEIAKAKVDEAVAAKS
ncbi:hypothetical protein [Massilia sp. DD77]|uniref:hypothetical protein n=1 Tax=Massilia sp. DD77 TaxID=3109349 RepID=UPI002FFE7305